MTTKKLQQKPVAAARPAAAPPLPRPRNRTPPPPDARAIQWLVERATGVEEVEHESRAPKLGGFGDIVELARSATRGPGGPLPFHAQIQASFGRHSISGAIAHTDAAAATGARSMGAAAFTMGNHVAFAGAPSLHTAAHEAAHVIQQRAGVQLAGGLGAVGDRYERHADEVADRVVRGHSSEALLDAFAPDGRTSGAALQRQCECGGDPSCDCTTRVVIQRKVAAVPLAQAHDPIHEDDYPGYGWQAIGQPFDENERSPDRASPPTVESDQRWSQALSDFLRRMNHKHAALIKQRVAELPDVTIADVEACTVAWVERGLGPYAYWSFHHPTRGVLARAHVSWYGSRGTEHRQDYWTVWLFAPPPAHAPLGEGHDQQATMGPHGARAASNEKARLRPGAPVHGDWSVLAKPELAMHYVRVLDHFTDFKLNAEQRTAAADGLTTDELLHMLGKDTYLIALTDLYTQGYREYAAAAASEVEPFFLLEETIIEQYVRGNQNALRNGLEIGHGYPEQDVLGIISRANGLLLYGPDGHPLPGLGGIGFRDGYYQGAPPLSSPFDIGLADDPELAWFLGKLRQELTDPVVASVAAARIYMRNIDRVNAEVQRDLPRQIVEQFEDMLPAFVGFLAGHGLASLLTSVPSPIAQAVGWSLRGLLTAAGYVMDIAFGLGALQRLLQAAYHLSRVQQKDGQLTELSGEHIKAAAAPIRQMVVDIALTAATSALGKLLHGARGGDEPARIDCTKCRVRRTKARAADRMHEGQELHFEPAQIERMRKTIIERPRLDKEPQREHPGESDHKVPTDVVLETINDPQVVLVAENGNWVFYRNGTIVVTPSGIKGRIFTAFGRGGTVPGRRLEDLRGLFGNPNLHVRDPEPPIKLGEWIAQQTGVFRVFRIWP